MSHLKTCIHSVMGYHTQTQSLWNINVMNGIIQWKQCLFTHIVDNIYCKNKNIRGKETHNTNSILIKQMINAEENHAQIIPNNCT